MSHLLDYSRLSHPTFSPGIGYGFLMVINLVSLTLIAGIVIKTDLIGDAYAPLVGLFAGIPYTIGQLCFGTFPAIVYFSKFASTKRWRFLIPLIVIAILAFLTCGMFTALCIYMPRTHGSGC